MRAEGAKASCQRDFHSINVLSEFQIHAYADNTVGTGEGVGYACFLHIVVIVQHLQVLLWHMVDIHLIASLQELLRLQAAEIRQVIRGIDETLVEVVNDIDALVGAASKSLCRIHQQFYLVVILLRYVIYLIGMEEEVIFVVAHKQTL